MPALSPQDYELLIKKSLPERLREQAKQFSIPEKYLTQMPDLIVLVLESRSMDKAEEKQSWFNLMPMMNDEQIAKLNDILTREKQKLQEIEQKYEQKKIEIKKKYLLRRQNMGYVKKVQDIKAQEAQAQQVENQEADSLLQNL